MAGCSPAAAGSGILVVEHFDDVDAFVVDDGKGGETLWIKAAIVFEIDEDLSGAGIGLGGFGKGERAADVLLSDGIVFDGGMGPSSVDWRLGADAELRDEIGDDAVDAGAVVEMMLDEIVEAVGTVGGPVAMDGNGEITPRRDELDLVSGGGGVFEESGFEERMIVGSGYGLRSRFCRGGRFRFGSGLRWRWSLRRRIESETTGENYKTGGQLTHS